MVEQGSSIEIAEDNLEVLSLTDPDLEQNLCKAAGLGEEAGAPAAGSPRGGCRSLSPAPPGAQANVLLDSHLLTGTPVLLTDFEKNVPWCPALEELMQKESFGGALHSKSVEDLAQVPPCFRLYLYTELPLEALAAGKGGAQVPSWLSPVESLPRERRWVEAGHPESHLRLPSQRGREALETPSCCGWKQS